MLNMNKNVTVDRDKFIGGSDCPYILGYATKYGKTPYIFAQEKAGVIDNNFQGNEITRYGQLMEPIIRDYINKKYNANYKEDTIINEEEKFRANTDGIDKNILEIKTFGSELNVDYYMPQCQFYMNMFDCDKCLLVGYKRPEDFYIGLDYELENEDKYFNLGFDKNDIVEYEIEYDPNLWNKIKERIKSFQNAVEKMKENKNMTEEEFNKLFYGNDIVRKYAQLVVLENKLTEFKDYENKYNQLKTDIYNLFEEKGILSFDIGSMKITKVEPTSYDTISIDKDKLKEENPSIYEKYKVIKTTNRKGYILITKRSEK